jgi:hypothetical protein
MDALRLASRCAASRIRKASPSASPTEMIRKAGSIATWAATMKMARSSDSAPSFDRKTSRLVTGSTSSTRASVSSGNNDWLTSSVANATTSIGTPMVNISSEIR